MPGKPDFGELKALIIILIFVDFKMLFCQKVTVHKDRKFPL